VWGDPQQQAARPPITCPDCGRSVNPGGKLCPHCGYPLMFETSAPVDQPVPEYLRKPATVDHSRERETGMYGAPVAGPPPVIQQPVALGPHCPVCGHRNGARRVRCEICAAELWPGAAFPARQPAYPARPVTQVRRRRFPWGAVAFVAAAIAAVVAVYFLAYALA
jgi:hypothetical protein